MVSARLRMMASCFAVLSAFALAAGHAAADEIVGKVKSVDPATNKVVITEIATSKDREITVDSGTAWTKEKKGKVAKKFDLAKLKVGAEVEVTSQGSLASKVLIKPGKKKAKVA